MGLTGHACECAVCQAGTDAVVIRHHQHINLVLSRLGEAQRRWYMGSLSTGADAPSDGVLAQISGMTEKTIGRGRADLRAGLAAAAVGRQRRSGGGRKRAEKKTRP